MSSQTGHEGQIVGDTVLPFNDAAGERRLVIMTQLEWLAEDVLCAVRGRSLHTQDWGAHGVSVDSRTAKPAIFLSRSRGHPSTDTIMCARRSMLALLWPSLTINRRMCLPMRRCCLSKTPFPPCKIWAGAVGRGLARIAAVTGGSVGKTSSKEQLRLMLGSVDDTYANERQP